MNYFDGTFIQFGSANEHDKGAQGIRAIAYVNGNIWMAHEELSGIAIADSDSGAINNIIPFDGPIGLHYSEARGVVYVSCKSKSLGGIVYALDAESYDIISTYENRKMVHPTGG
jgi:hypothetical protein